MFLLKRKCFKLFTIIAALFLTMTIWAAGPPATNPFSNSLAVLLISMMIILLIVIGILARILVGAAGVAILKKKKAKEKKPILQQVAAIFIGFMLLNTKVFSQDQVSVLKTVEISTKIGGLPASDFYIMSGIIFLELIVIAVLLINTRFLLRSQKKSLIGAEAM
jgi:cytochrome c oxidase cbb3-type subunit 3